MEGGYPDIPPVRANQLGDTLLHFAGRFIRKGNRQDRPRRRFAVRNQPGNAVGKHARLAAARSGHNQEWSFGSFYSLALWRIQPAYGVLYVNKLHV
ncbi:hypothetical protein D3C75_621600 [compost metagenome]